MTKIEYPDVCSTIYTDPAKQDCKQREYIIQGVAGKQIYLEQVALSLMVVKSGIIGTAWVTVQYPGGQETKIAEWTETRTTYQKKSFSPGVSVPAGISLTLRYYLTTSNSAYRSRMNSLNYTYSLVEVPVIVEPETPNTDTVEASEEIPAIISIKCDSEKKALEQVAKIKSVIGNLDVEIFKSV